MIPLNHEKRLGAKSGTIVFVHDNSSSMRIFDPVFNSERVPYSLFRMDLPGHGDSYSSESAEAYSIASYSTILEKILESIDDDILLVGNTFGGHLCIEVAPRLKNLKGMLIFGAPPVKKPINLEEAFNTFQMMGFRFLEAATEETAFGMFSRICFNQEIVPEIVDDFLHADARVRSTLWNELAAKKLSDEVEILATLKVPRYFMLGDLDLMVNQKYLRSVNNPKNPYKVIELQNCGAYPTVDQPEIFIKHLNRIAEEVFP